MHPQETVLQANPEPVAALRLARSRNVGPRSFTRLARRFGSPEAALQALPDLAARGGDREYTAYPEDAAKAEMDAGLALGARLAVIGTPDYPERLAEIHDAPPVLWLTGAPEIYTRPAVAIVGARNASATGLRIARRLARELGEAGFVIVSGLARGIDTAAHGAALETGTLAVMAGGLDVVYPEENTELAAEIAARGGAVSECPLGTEPTSRHFPRRNRIVSGLALGTVLIEAAERSGSLITARYALEQGREAMACPGAPDDPRAGGCNHLIREGAALIRNAEDVMEALGISGATPAGLAEPGRPFLFEPEDFDDDADDLDALADFDDEGHDQNDTLVEQILRLLGTHPVEIDELARQCGVPVSALSLPLLELDLAGRIAMRPGGGVSLTVL